jgi:ABC-type multidrug transport system ATPase subunit
MNLLSSAQHRVEIEDLTKTYGTFYAVRHFNLSVSRGEIFALLGPNGAGKTTTIRMLMGGPPLQERPKSMVLTAFVTV